MCTCIRINYVKKRKRTKKLENSVWILERQIKYTNKTKTHLLVRGLSEAISLVESTAAVIFLLLMPLSQGFLLPLVLAKVFEEADAEVALV